MFSPEQLNESMVGVRVRVTNAGLNMPPVEGIIIDGPIFYAPDGRYKYHLDSDRGLVNFLKNDQIEVV